MTTTTQYVPALNDNGHIEHDGIEFPVEPYRTNNASYMATEEAPPVHRRWLKFAVGGEEHNVYWAGQCASCTCTLWTTDSDYLDIADWSSARHVPYMYPHSVAGQEFLICCRCVDYGNEYRIDEDGENRRIMGLQVTPFSWPPDFMAEREREAQRDDPWSVIYPVEPVHGAFVFVKGDPTAHQFDRWEDGRIVLIGGSESGIAPDMVEVATPIILGVKHPRVVALPSSGVTGRRGRIIRRRANNVTFQTEDGVNYTWLADCVAVLAPPLDPTTETPEETVVRLRREADRMRVMMHTRMVAEGEQRRWCEAFDPILIGTGLDPRKPKRVFTGTMTFRWETDNNADIEDIRKTWHNYIPSSDVSVVDITESTPTTSRVLS